MRAEHLLHDVHDPRLADAISIASRCHYPVGRTNTISSVSLAVEQAPFNRAKEIRWKWLRYRDKGLKPHRIGDVLWYQSRGVETGYTLRRPDTTDVSFFLSLSGIPESYEGKPRQRIVDRLLAGVAATISAGPQGPPRHTYTGPAGQSPTACAVLTPDLFARYAGEPDSGYVEETFTPDESSAVYGEFGPFVETTCELRRAEQVVGHSLDAELVVELRRYREVRDAERAATQLCDPDLRRGVEPVDGRYRIGAATCLNPKLERHPGLVFQAGPHTLWLVAPTSRATPEALVAKLFPLAERIAAALR